jgi:transposase-like protein
MEKLVDQNTLDHRYGTKGVYKLSFIKELVNQLEAGISHRELAGQYGLHVRTLRDWGTKYGNASKIPVRRKNYTPVQKRSIARSVIEGGQTIKSAAKINCISIRTVRHWIATEKHELYSTNSIILNKSEKEKATDQPVAVGGEIKRLQEQLAEANLRIAALNTLIDVAEEQLNINIRKKPGAKQS